MNYDINETAKETLRNQQMNQMEFYKKSIGFYKHVIIGFVFSFIIFLIFWGILPRMMENSDKNIHFLTFVPVKVSMSVFAILCSRAIGYYIKFTKIKKSEEVSDE